MKLLSIDYIPGTEIEALGMVKGTVVQTKNVGRDFMAGMKTLVGGEIVGYTEMLNEARQIAVKRMVDEAKERRCGNWCKIWFITGYEWSSRSDCLWYCRKNYRQVIK